MSFGREVFGGAITVTSGAVRAVPSERDFLLGGQKMHIKDRTKTTHIGLL
jgi:hypothetical protein